ncbi:MAG TPA: tetratricopeptide repeat protein, partial [Gemmataceae bacterium]
GLCYERQGRWAEALADFSEALRHHAALRDRDPGNPDNQRRARDRQAEVERVRARLAAGTPVSPPSPGPDRAGQSRPRP